MDPGANKGIWLQNVTDGKGDKDEFSVFNYARCFLLNEIYNSDIDTFCMKLLVLQYLGEKLKQIRCILILHVYENLPECI